MTIAYKIKAYRKVIESVTSHAKLTITIYRGERIGIDGKVCCDISNERAKQLPASKLKMPFSLGN